EGEVTLDVRDVAVADPGATYLHEDLARSRLRDRHVGQPERGAGFVEQPSLHGILHRKWGGVSGYPPHCHARSGASRDSCPAGSVRSPPRSLGTPCTAERGRTT